MGPLFLFLCFRLLHLYFNLLLPSSTFTIIHLTCASFKLALYLVCSIALDLHTLPNNDTTRMHLFYSLATWLFEFAPHIINLLICWCCFFFLRRVHNILLCSSCRRLHQCCDVSHLMLLLEARTPTCKQMLVKRNVDCKCDSVILADGKFMSLVGNRWCRLGAR